MPFDTNIIISLGVVFFISQIIYSVAGFGSGMFAISILSLLYGKPDFFVPLLVLACIPTELYVTLKSFKNLSFKDNLPIYLGSFPALIAGTFFLKNTNSSFLLFLMGFILLLSCMASFYRSKSNNKKKYLACHLLLLVSSADYLEAYLVWLVHHLLSIFSF